MSKKLFVEPNDVLLFRDGRSFSAGIDHLAMGVFPPPPIPFYHALRSAVLAQNNVPFSATALNRVSGKLLEEVGTPSKEGSMRLSFFSLACRSGIDVTPLFPTPNDVLRYKEKKDNYVIFKPRSFKLNVRTNYPAPFLRWVWGDSISEKEFSESAGGFLNAEDFENYLRGGGQKVSPVELSDVFVKEPRVGIRINNATKTTGEGNLFSVEFTRLNKSIGFALAIENITLLEPRGYLRLGGESRSAYYEECTFLFIDKAEIARQVAEAKRFKLVLITPAVFANGWLPDGIEARTGEGTLGGSRVKLVGASIGRFQHIGGWDIIKERPKLTRRAVPAGSVYYFELLSDNLAALFDHVFGKSIVSDETDVKLGLGLSFIGTF